METIEQILEQRKKDALLRVLTPAQSRQNGRIHLAGKEYYDFSSNDYLGLSNHPKLKEAVKKATNLYPVGSCASRLLSGDLNIHHELEEKTAQLKGKQSALVFNSGYQANIGIISGLYGKADAILADKLSHASILDGIALSGARCYRFHHNDSNHLETLLKKTDNKFTNRLIVTESLFSMDGDKAPLKELVELKNKYNCKIMIDEAHATGIFGKNGSGLIEQTGLTDSIDLIMGTFSKGLGGFGGYLASSSIIIEYLINTCRSFIYSTSLPACIIAANLAALELLKTEPNRRKTLIENADYFRTQLKAKGFHVTGSSQIVPLIVNDTEKALAMSKHLAQKGFRALAIRPPTIPAGQSRIRFSLTYHHNKKILQNLTQELEKYYV
ncbi:8-amino-7-oxononanoate synthase [Planctomycetota bacterium]